MVKVREIVVHPPSQSATDLATLNLASSERVPVPDGLDQKEFNVWLTGTLSVVDVLFPGSGVWQQVECIKWDDFFSSFKSSFLHMRKTSHTGGDLAKKQKTEEYEDFRGRAFRLEFQNSDKVSIMHQALTCIMQKSGYAPSAGLFQSSGWGKSRLVCELWKKDVWVVYCSFAAGSGYPKKSWIADWFFQQATEHLGISDSLEGQIMCMWFTVAYFSACIRMLVAGVKEKSWNYEKFLLETREGSEYWQAVQEETNKRLKDFLGGGVMTQSQGSKELTWTTWEQEAKIKFLKFLPKDFIMVDNKKLGVLFVFDEARHLVKNKQHLNCFLPIRRATRATAQIGVAVLFMDTSSEITNFSAPDWSDPSDRIATGKAYMLAPPIWGPFSADISEKDSLQLLSTRTCKDIARRHCAVKYGRPLWWATFRSALDALSPGEENTELLMENAFEVTYSLARDKLLGGAGKWDKVFVKGEDLTEEAAVSLLGAAIGVDVDPRSKLVSKLVASHLLSVLSVSPTRELVWTVWSTEPLVSMAAAEACKRLNESGRSRQLYSSLVDGLAAGWIDTGFTGELVAKIILLHAKSKGEPGFCTVDNFCKHLVGSSLSELIGRGLTDEEKKLANARLHFNSFRRIYKKLSDMTFDDFLKCAERGCAIQCVAGTWGVDLLMVAFTGSDDDKLTVENTTVIYAQVKFKEKEDALNVAAAKASPHYAGLKVALKLPYLTLYMNVFDKVGGARAYWVDSKDVSASVEACSSKPIQNALKEIAREQNMADLMEVDLQKKGPRPAVKAWKAWLQARALNLQTVVAVKGMEAFNLDEGLKDQLRKIVKTSRSPFATDHPNALHKELLELQKSGVQDMFRVENFEALE
ncbi:hypothetical protein L7F22_050581 [Adiantum nelumboides]|nr:hypothetical protein [Adiantum nelumboides]